MTMKQQREFGDALDQLSTKYYASPGSRKPRLYLYEYDKIFHTMRDKPIRLLELGVQDGFSMQVWKDYFSQAIIVGLDQSEQPAAFPKDKRFHFVQGSQNDPVALDSAVRLAGGPFDVIIDDASHYGCYTAQSFDHLFPNHLKPGGFYIIEDICTAFSLCGGFDDAPYTPPDLGQPGEPKVFPSHQHGIVGVGKQIMDHIFSPVATRTSTWTKYPVYRMTALANIFIFEKLDND